MKINLRMMVMALGGSLLLSWVHGTRSGFTGLMGRLYGRGKDNE